MWTIWIILFIIGYFIPDFQRGFGKSGKHWFGVQFSERQQGLDPVQEILQKSIRQFRMAYGIGFLLLPLSLISLDFMNEGIGVAYWIVLLWSLHIFFHRRLKQFKGGLQPDPAVKIVRTADLSPRPSLPAKYHLGFLLAVIVAAATWILMIVQYDKLPDPLPVQWDLFGQPNGFAPKNLNAVHQGAGLIFILTLVLYYFATRHYQAKRLIDPARPKTAIMRYQIARDRMSLYMMVLVNALALHFAILQLGALYALPAWIFTASSIVMFAVAFGGIAIYYATTGDHGQRLKIKSKEVGNDRLEAPDDDQYWKGGIIYYNPNDPTLWVPKRFSGGYTVNAGHPVGKLVYIGIILLLLSLIFFRQ